MELICAVYFLMAIDRFTIICASSMRPVTGVNDEINLNSIFSTAFSIRSSIVSLVKSLTRAIMTFDAKEGSSWTKSLADDSFKNSNKPPSGIISFSSSMSLMPICLRMKSTLMPQISRTNFNIEARVGLVGNEILDFGSHKCMSSSMTWKINGKKLFQIPSNPLHLSSVSCSAVPRFLEIASLFFNKSGAISLKCLISSGFTPAAVNASSTVGQA